jgi:1-acyl-sn-glycerol-3-phosphate acyltransferase
VMTAAWTPAGTAWSRLQAAASVRLFPRLASLYGFIPMPPMPPRPFEAAARAQAVRQVLSAVRRSPPPLLAISPEGQDTPGGALMRPHPGVGRMLAHLAKSGYPFHPVGVHESEALRLIRSPWPFPAGWINSGKVDRQARITPYRRSLPACRSSYEEYA